jgi:hypothetical protein
MHISTSGVALIVGVKGLVVTQTLDMQALNAKCVRPCAANTCSFFLNTMFWIVMNR